MGAPNLFFVSGAIWPRYVPDSNGHQIGKKDQNLTEKVTTHRRNQGAMTPQSISSHFTLWETVSQTKYCCSTRSQEFCSPPKFWAGYPTVTAGGRYTIPPRSSSIRERKWIKYDGTDYLWKTYPN